MPMTHTIAVAVKKTSHNRFISFSPSYAAVLCMPILSIPCDVSRLYGANTGVYERVALASASIRFNVSYSNSCISRPSYSSIPISNSRRMTNCFFNCRLYSSDVQAFRSISNPLTTFALGKPFRKGHRFYVRISHTCQFRTNSHHIDSDIRVGTQKGRSSLLNSIGSPLKNGSSS